MRFAEVVIDEVHSQDRVYDYLIPEELKDKIKQGSRVFVPFGKRPEVEAFVVGLKDESKLEDEGRWSGLTPPKIKYITKAPDNFVALKREALELAPLICNMYKLRTVDVLRLFVPGMVRGRKRERVARNKELAALDIAQKNITLTSEQQGVIKTILEGESGVFVLHGVTGSGKTEVYMNVIQRVLERGKSAIMLVPEIGLTPQMLGNFRARFGDTVAMIHSGLSPTERYDQWLRLHRGEARIVVGARSAVFAPLENIGAIIIDEEHDTSYFAESNPRFHTHEIAKLRAGFNNCPVVLGSATPSLETMHKLGQYQLLTLSKRVNERAMPKIHIIDMVAEIRGGNGGILSRDLQLALKETLEAGKQAIIFLNRRGFSSYVGCLECGWVARCEHCDVSLVWHKEDGQLKCHYCSARYSRAHTCKECSSTMLRYGQIGTQRLAEELGTLFPNTPIFRLDADNAKEKGNLVQILGEFASSKSGILVGTQMIAKGHDFPAVALVGIIDADNALHFADYRASERAFALITQVAGRAGRAEAVGRVFLQTFRPKHYVYRLASCYDYAKFLEMELSTRQATNFPPYTTIVRILVTGEEDTTIKQYIASVMKKLRTREGELEYLGAMRSPLGRLMNKFRYQILVRFGARDGILDWIDEVIKGEETKKSMNVFLEINPQSLS